MKMRHNWEKILKSVPTKRRQETKKLILQHYNDVELNDHPVIWTDNVIRFRSSSLQYWLKEHVSLNDLWIEYANKRFTKEEVMQFYRDIGYSLCGFTEIFPMKGKKK